MNNSRGQYLTSSTLLVCMALAGIAQAESNINREKVSGFDLSGDSQTARKKIHKIIGGKPASINKHPWMAALIDTSDNQQFCGGSLIRDTWVVTAAHCVENVKPDQVKILLGSASLKDRSGGKEHSIEAIFPHAEYDFDHDIALLKLKTSSNQVTITTANKTLDNSLTDNTPLTVTGWGLTSSAQDATSSNDLLEVTVPLRNRNQCRAAYKQSDDIDITDNMILCRQCNRTERFL